MFCFQVSWICLVRRVCALYFFVISVEFAVSEKSLLSSILFSVESAWPEWWWVYNFSLSSLFCWLPLLVLYNHTHFQNSFCLGLSVQWADYFQVQRMEKVHFVSKVMLLNSQGSCRWSVWLCLQLRVQDQKVCRVLSLVYVCMWCIHVSCHRDCLVGLVVRCPPRERKVLGSNPACAGIFSGSSHTSDLNIGTPVATLPSAWRYRVSAGTGQPGVSILWLGEMESWICNFYLSVAARKFVWADLSLRYTRMLLGR